MSPMNDIPKQLANQRCVIASLAEPLQAAIEAACTNAGAEVQVLAPNATRDGSAQLAQFSGGEPPTVWIQGLTTNPTETVTELTLEAFRSSNVANLEAVFLGTQMAFAAMSEGGAIVNVFATSGRTPGTGSTALAAASSGLEVHTRATAIEGAGQDPQIRANGLALSRSLWEPTPSSSVLQAAAASAVFLASEAAAYCTGSTLVHESSG